MTASVSESVAVAAPGFGFAVLGPLLITHSGQELRLSSRKQRMLVASLLVAPNQVVSLSDLSETLWADTAPPSAELTLRSLVSRLRATFTISEPRPPGGQAGSSREDNQPGRALLVGRDGGYLLRLDQDRTDRARFEMYLAQGRAAMATGRPRAAVAALTAGLALWRGPAYAEIADTPIAEAVAHGLEQARVEATELLADAQLALGQPVDALAILEPHLRAHPFREGAWEQYMLGLYRLDRQSEALAAYQQLRRRLREELGVEPSPNLRRLQRRILLQDRDLDRLPVDPDTDTPTTRTSPSGSASSPLALTPLVGRETELTELVSHLDRTRLLTLTGTGGVGKTRLAYALAHAIAQRVAARHTARFSDGTRVVELAGVVEDDLVLAHTASALQIPTAGTSTGTQLRQRLADTLADQQVLVVFDNCEHVITPIAGLVESLLTHCPGLTVVATSREPLAVPGEMIYPVPSLSLPPPETTNPRDLEGSSAAALFCQRAAVAHTGFAPTKENAAAIAAICRRLDGIPLALELAAGKLRALAAQDIADRLDDRFQLLTGGARTALPRQQTLRAALEWSFDLLTHTEQTLLCQLSVFPSSFDLAAAETVGTPDPEQAKDRAGNATPTRGEDAGREPTSRGAAVAELVQRLADKSMIAVRRSDHTIRYQLLETVKAFCAQQPTTAVFQDLARDRHCAHYVRLAAAQRAAHPAHWDTPGWVRHTIVEEDNYRAATSHALAQHNPDAALLLLGALWGTWIWTGRIENVVEWFDQVLAAPVTDRVAEVEGAIGLAVLSAAWDLDTPERTDQRFTHACQLAEQLGEPAPIVRARYFQAERRLARGHLEEAKTALLAAERTTTDRGLIGWCHLTLGFIALAERDYDLARSRLRSAVELGSDSETLIPHALSALAPLTALVGDHTEAAQLATQALTQTEQLPLPTIRTMVLLRAAQTRLLCGDHRGAVEALGELFILLRRLHSRRFHAEAFEIAAVAAQQHGDPALAARYLGVSDRIRGERAADHSGANVLEARILAVRTEARALLGAAGFAAAEHTGRALAPGPALHEATISLTRLSGGAE